MQRINLYAVDSVMPLWVKLLELLVKTLIWCYGHQAVLQKVMKYTPLKPDANPSLPQTNNPNLKDHYGSL